MNGNDDTPMPGVGNPQEDDGGAEKEQPEAAPSPEEKPEATPGM